MLDRVAHGGSVALASFVERRRFGYRRLHVPLVGRCAANHKPLFRICREERLGVRKRGGRKRALGTRSPMAFPQAAGSPTKALKAPPGSAAYQYRGHHQGQRGPRHSCIRPMDRAQINEFWYRPRRCKTRPFLGSRCETHAQDGQDKTRCSLVGRYGGGHLRQQPIHPD
jgi:hypothetical protein